MKHLMKFWILLTASLVFTPMFVWSDDANSGGGNQLMKNQTHWYQEAATLVGPVEGVSPKSGTLLTLQTGSVLYMEGGSTLHMYQMRANSLKGSAVVKGPSTDLLTALKAGMVGFVSLVVPVEAFKSRESGLDDNAYKALKLKENPEIRFALTNEKLAPGTTSDTYVMTATGTLTIAGETAPVTLAGDAIISGNQVRFKGVQKLKMSDFKVTPPSISLVVTSITCTDDIEVHYDVIFAVK